MVASILTLFSGCGTKTNRAATEQMLLSDAVDRAVSQVDFRPLAGQEVFLDTVYLQMARSPNLVNSEYVISSLRHQLTKAGCYLKESRGEARVIVEPRIGALGTDGHEVVYGIPPADVSRSLGAAITGSGAAFSLLPEVSLGKNNAQSAVAKLVVYAYERETAEAVWQSGIAQAESSSRDVWVLGAGPFQSGTIYDGVRFAGKNIEKPAVPFLTSLTFKDLNQKEEEPEPVVFATDESNLYFPAIPAPLKPDSKLPLVDPNVQQAGDEQ